MAPIYKGKHRPLAVPGTLRHQRKKKELEPIRHGSLRRLCIQAGFVTRHGEVLLDYTKKCVLSSLGNVVLRAHVIMQSSGRRKLSLADVVAGVHQSGMRVVSTSG